MKYRPIIKAIPAKTPKPNSRCASNIHFTPAANAEKTMNPMQSTKIWRRSIRMAQALTAAILATMGLVVHAYGAATILPPAETCFQATAGVNGMVGTLGTITGGTGGAAGTYAGVALTGGSGSGATANIVVAGGTVTSVTILNPGTQYVVGDTLSAAAATIGNTTGFSVPLLSVAINSSLAGGTVTFYIPNTTTFKQTWKNAAQTVLNTNPVPLDQNGCMIAYGTGIYRQILKDNLGNTVFDQITTDVSANNSTFWAGVSGGTPNVITVVDAGFNATDGSIVNFTALATNTGPATLNPSGFGAFAILKDTTAGPVALTGGEIVQGNPISVIFRASDNAFHLLNAVIASASGATAPLCGASGLTITNNSGTPNSVISLTARQAVIQTIAGLTINRSNVSLTAINISTGTVTPTANGMDGEAPGTSAWLYVWAIDNGAAPAGLVSVAANNGLNPNMPSGYTYKCLMGSMRVDAAGNLFRTFQRGNEVEWKPDNSANNIAFPVLFTGAAPGVGSWTTQSVTAIVPPTAVRVRGAVAVTADPTKVACVSGSPFPTSANVCAVQPGAMVVTAGIAGFNPTANYDIVLGASQQIFWAGTSGATMVLFGTGWKDAVNAN